MKNTWKKGLGVLMVITLLLSGLVAPTQQAQAAAKMTKADITKSYGKYKRNFIKLYANDKCAFHCNNLIDETEKPSKLFRTKRGIALDSTKSNVIKKYGKGTFKKVNVKSDNFYYVLRKTGDTSSSKLLKTLKRYVDYTYKTDRNEYRLRFYFDKQNKVKTIAYSKNYSNFKNYSWN